MIIEGSTELIAIENEKKLTTISSSDLRITFTTTASSAMDCRCDVRVYDNILSKETSQNVLGRHVTHSMPGFYLAVHAAVYYSHTIAREKSKCNDA